MSVQDQLEADAYAADPTLFWLWPYRDNVPINKASQKPEPFWMFIGLEEYELFPRYRRPPVEALKRKPDGQIRYRGHTADEWIAAGGLPLGFCNDGS